MYTLGSTEFNQIIETPNNQSVKKRLVLLDNGTIIDKIKSLTLYSSSSSQELQLGTTNMSYIDAEVECDLLLTNREVRLECGVELSDGSEEYIPMGVFTIQKPQGDIDFVKFKAHDNMQKFEKVYSSELTYPTTSDLVLDEICNMCGVTLSTPIENPIEITEKLQGYTCREVLGFIAGIHGKFACIDRLGTLNLRWYSETPIDKQIGLIWAFNKSDDDFTVDKIEIAKDTETNYTSGSGFSAIYHSNPLATQEITDELFSKLDGFTYNASTIDILDDIRLDIWDVIKVIYLDGKEYLVPCMSLKQDFGQGSTSIQSFAKTNTENEYRYNGAMTNYVNRIAMELLLTNRIVATKVDAEYVNSVAITTENFEAKVAEIKELVVEEIDGKYATIDFANIDVANINKTNIGLLFAEVGLLDRATIVDGHVTGFLDAVEINANKITAGTLMVDRLIFRGNENSIIYQLNNITSKNLIPYPYTESTHEDNGIIWTELGNGKIMASGTATGDSTFVLPPFTVPAGTYTISGSIPVENTAIQLATNGSYAMSSNWLNLTKTITYNEETYFNYCRILIKAGVTVEDVIFEPMLVSGSEVLPFEPYRECTQGLTSETVNGEVLTDRTITADKIIAKSITSNEIDVAELFANQAAITTLITQDAFIDAIETNRIVVGASDIANEALNKVKSTVKSITMHYLATTASSGVTTSTSGWTTTVQQINATKKYLWTYQTITYVDNTTTDTSPVISGVYGNEGKDGKDGEDGTNGTNGVGITSVVPLYYLKSNTTAPSAPTSAVTSTSTGSGVWTKSVPFYVSGYTYFTCTQTKYTDGTFTWSTVIADNSLTEAYASLENKADIDEVVAVNLLPYPYYESTHTENVITWTVNTDGTIGVSSGTPTADCYFVFRHHATADKIHLVIPAGTYTLSGGTSKIPLSAWKIENGVTTTQLALDNGKGATFTVNTDTRLNVRLHITNGTVVTATTIKPMLEVGSVAHHYTEYSKGGVGITNNIYQAGTTLIDGGKIYTGSILADSINVEDLFAQNIVIQPGGKFTATGNVWVKPTIDDYYLVMSYYNGTKTPTAQQKMASDFDKDGSVDLLDVGYISDIIKGERDVQYFVNTYGYQPIKSDVEVVIDPLNAEKVIGISTTSSFGRDVEVYLGVNGLKTPYVSSSRIECGDLKVTADISCEQTVISNSIITADDIYGGGDVYALYGTDTEVSLLGLNERVNYLQPHPYSLIRSQDIGAVTTTQTAYNTFNSRKISDYGMILISVGSSETDVRATMVVPRAVFDNTPSVVKTFYIDNQIAVKWNSDTKITIYATSGSATNKYVNIYGLKVDAALSGKSVDIL